MKAHEVAEHILAKIDEIVQSDDLNKWHTEPGQNNSLHTNADKRLTALSNVLDAVTRYSAEEPKPRQSAGAVAGG